MSPAYARRSCIGTVRLEPLIQRARKAKEPRLTATAFETRIMPYRAGKKKNMMMMMNMKNYLLWRENAWEEEN
jgi:hypothetical protein